MENIHILQTDKPSRLAYDFDKLVLNSRLLSPILYKTQNIYITSDEEINQQTKPCWCINTIKNTWDADLIYYQGSMPQYHYVGFKKIILTTDLDLIKDGVQAIDDEFLEWFVHNPSCEMVEVENNWIGWTIHTYKIIIPKDEHEIYTQDDYFNDEFPKEKPKQHVELINDNIEEFDKTIKLFKEETLEEFCNRELENFNGGNTRSTEFDLGFRTGAIIGLRFPKERSYSKEEVLEMMRITRRNEDWTVSQLFEQFKKKYDEKHTHITNR